MSGAPSLRCVGACRSGRHSPGSIHAPLEVRPSALGEFDVGSRHGTGVLLDGVQQDHQVLGALVEDPVPGVGEAHPQLPQLALELR